MSLAAAARSADALVYDKLTPYCHFIKINMYCGESDTFCGCSFCGGLSFPCRCRVQRRLRTAPYRSYLYHNIQSFSIDNITNGIHTTTTTNKPIYHNILIKYFLHSLDNSPLNSIISFHKLLRLDEFYCNFLHSRLQSFLYSTNEN